MTERKNAVMRLIEVGVKAGVLVKGEMPNDTEENLDTLLSCIDAAFSDYQGCGLEVEEFCKILLVGNNTFSIKDYEEIEEKAKTYLQGLEQGRYLTLCNHVPQDVIFYPPRHRNLDFGGDGADLS